MYIYGANPIKDLFESKPDKIKKVFLNKKRHQTFANSLEKFHIKVEDFNVSNFKEFRDVNHQEIVASISDPIILDTKQLIEINEDVKNPVILILDQINDPQNFGAIIRNVSAFGGNGIITSIHGSTPLTATAIKTSAGTWSNVHIAAESNLASSVKKLKDAGYWIAVTTMEGQSTLDDLKEFDRPLAIILGNEGKGVKKSLIDNADLNVSIKMRSNTESLNVSVTSGVILHYLK